MFRFSGLPKGENRVVLEKPAFIFLIFIPAKGEGVHS
jgi:hypothetical protein